MNHSGQYEGDLLEEMDNILRTANAKPVDEQPAYLRRASHRLDEWVAHCQAEEIELTGCGPVATLMARTELELLASNIQERKEKERRAA